jgi:hypothetical protein
MDGEQPKSTTTAVVDAEGRTVDYRVLAAELARAAEYYVLTVHQRLGEDKARVALERVVARYKEGTLDGLSELRIAVRRALFSLRTIAHKLPVEAKAILRELAETAEKYEERR